MVFFLPNIVGCSHRVHNRHIARFGCRMGAGFGVGVAVFLIWAGRRAVDRVRFWVRALVMIVRMTVVHRDFLGVSDVARSHLTQIAFQASSISLLLKSG